MLKNNHADNNLIVCEVAEQKMVSVLYEEADPIEEQEFAQHLADCKICQVEFASFGEIKNTFSIWRDNELANLEAPQIIWPNEEKDLSIIHPKTNWSTKLSEFFLFPKFQWQSAGVLTAFVICAALLLIASLSTLEQIKIDRSVKNNNLPLKQTVQTPNLNALNKSENTELSPSASEPVQPKGNLVAGRIEVNKSKTTISSSKPRVWLVDERRKSVISKTKSVRSKNLPAEVVLPALEEEENSMRLSDLLAEVGPVS